MRLEEKIAQYVAERQRQIEQQIAAQSENADVMRILGNLPEDVALVEVHYGATINVVTAKLRVADRQTFTLNFSLDSQTVGIGAGRVNMGLDPFWENPNVIRAIYLVLRQGAYS
jgi:hypothetical protein